MTITAIPTNYDDEWYRSKLEAKWAAFFKIIGWPFEYEPGFLKGYIPDFVIHFPHGDLLVEVKPIEMESEDIRNIRFSPVAAEAIKKINNSGWIGEALLVGTKPYSINNVFFPTVGIFYENFIPSSYSLYEGYGWGRGLLIRCLKCKKISLTHFEGNWHCRFNGCQDGNRHWSAYPEIRDDWSQAVKNIQWKPR